MFLVHSTMANKNYVTWGWDMKLFMLVSTTISCIGRSLRICNFVQLAVSLGTRLVLITEENNLLLHFFLIPRLQCLFVSQEGSSDMRWHHDKQVQTDDVLRHPTNVNGWKHFDSEFPNFAADAWNIRLGLASDGFNPFGHMSTSYNMWHMVLIPYNFQPWKCMKE